MARARRLSQDQRRVLRLVGLMPLAAAAELALVLNAPPDGLRRRLSALRRSGWLASLRCGMSEPAQTRWLLTRRSLEHLYATDHTHPRPRERIGYERAWTLSGPAPAGRDQPPLDPGHEHLGPEAWRSAALLEAPAAEGGQHEHPPWSATARGAQVCLRRLAMLEPIYRLAPVLWRDGHLRGGGAPPDLSDFRLLRRSGFFVAVARYGDDLWVAFSYAGAHATERILRRKYAFRFWDLDCYVARERRSFRLSNRIFYEDPEQTVEPSALVVIAVDRWAAALARGLPGRTNAGAAGETIPTLICTAARRCGPPVEPNPSRDLISEPAARTSLGRPERLGRWLRGRPDAAALIGPAAYRLFLLLAEFPAMPADWLGEMGGLSPRAAARILRRFLLAGLAVRHERRFYLAQRGFLRAANLSRIQVSAVRNRHGAYLQARYRRIQQRHDDGVNRLALQFAREGTRAFAGWRGEVNIPGLTQLRPDLLLLVGAGPFGPGPYAIEFERRASTPGEVAAKLRPYLRAAAAGRGLPVLFVCETARGARGFAAAAAPRMLVATLEAAREGPLTGEQTVWAGSGPPVALYCQDQT